MEIDQIVEIAKRVHDAERYDLGRSSTREYRNKFWNRVMGIVHHGHPVYNPNGADRRWHIKNAGGGRPQSDDGAVLMPERVVYDCILGVGADGYSFHVGHPERVGPEQNVYPPDIPDGGGTSEPSKPQPTPVKPCPDPSAHQPKPPKPYPGDHTFLLLGAQLERDYLEAGQHLNGGAAVWFARTIFDHLNGGLSLEQSIDKHRNTPGGWRDALGLGR
jgi:hypothetical protein